MENGGVYFHKLYVKNFASMLSAYNLSCIGLNSRTFALKSISTMKASQNLRPHVGYLTIIPICFLNWTARNVILYLLAC